MVRHKVILLLDFSTNTWSAVFVLLKAIFSVHKYVYKEEYEKKAHKIQVGAFTFVSDIKINTNYE